jgi:hypothetical protein
MSKVESIRPKRRLQERFLLLSYAPNESVAMQNAIPRSPMLLLQRNAIYNRAVSYPSDLANYLLFNLWSMTLVISSWT